LPPATEAELEEFRASLLGVIDAVERCLLASLDLVERFEKGESGEALMASVTHAVRGLGQFMITLAETTAVAPLQREPGQVQ